ncbi:hypothetical protein [Streptomyces justiciae]|uniref:Uncharacterized protein n=1 Tax=Streptomyces justiciae TaxID=2780140 RepID=A0ABU3LW49_9ACTN|nr:hypothetical protein [Streptomyces justiciae]MDT7843323.1 hypothetical protein [Streptomyces justiciae]
MSFTVTEVPGLPAGFTDTFTSQTVTTDDGLTLSSAAAAPPC